MNITRSVNRRFVQLLAAVLTNQQLLNLASGRLYKGDDGVFYDESGRRVVDASVPQDERELAQLRDQLTAALRGGATLNDAGNATIAALQRQIQEKEAAIAARRKAGSGSGAPAPAGGGFGWGTVIE